MAKKEKGAAKAPEATPPVAEENTPPVPADPTPVGTEKGSGKTKKGSFDVYNRGGALVRTYSEEAHGKDAEKLAKEYAEKIGGAVK